MDWQRFLPVLASIGIIIAIAILREYSTTAAAVTATMPLQATLGLWVVYAAEKGNSTTITQFGASMVFGMLATVVFAMAVWLAARAGWRLLAMIAAGYVAWAVALALVLRLQQVLGMA